MLWAEYKKNCQAIKIHLCFELNRMIPVEIIVSNGNYSERKALLQMLKAGVTYIADRGYGAFYVYHEILLVHAHFVIRVKENVKKNVKKSLAVELPEKLTKLFKDVTDQIIQYKNDPYGHCYRLVSFQVGSEIFHLLTDRLELTTFQIIMLYAYRWQIELFFKFLKRTINGIHLIKNMENGVTIQFYALLIVALLELKLKQDINKDNPKLPATIKQPRALEKKKSTYSPSHSPLKSEPRHTNSQNRENHSSHSTSSDHHDDTHPTESSAPISQPHQFFEMIGENLQKYWKIGILWITTLQQSLHLQFNAHIIEILDSG
jgi:transposase